MPIASVSTASSVKAGVFQSCRSVKRISSNMEVTKRCISFGSESNDRIDARSAARRNPGCTEGRCEQKRAYHEIDSWVESVDIEKRALQYSRKCKGCNQTNHGTDQE